MWTNFLPGTRVARLATLFALAFALATTSSSYSINNDKPPEVAVTAGFTRLIFQDDFEGLDLDAHGPHSQTWYNGLWYERTTSADKISTADGILTLVTPPGTVHTSITTVPKQGNGGVTFHHGFFEARLRFSDDKNDWSAFWLMSRPHSLDSDNGHWCEIDIFEHFGAGIYVGAVHDWTSRKHSFNHGAYHRLNRSIEFSKWHNYALLWTPTKLTWFLDGSPVMEAVPPAICEEQDLFLILGSQKHKDGPEEKLEVDWVRVFSR
ncbi:hypothetical protein ACVWZL_000991 [Bradyrhizobium sp. GM2.4]